MNTKITRIINARERNDAHAEALARAEATQADQAAADRILARGKTGSK